jgi:hypothetical protein
MAMFVQNHIRGNGPIEVQFKACADTIKDASFVAYEALAVMNAPIAPLAPRTRTVPDEKRTGRDWLSVPELVDTVLDDLGTVPKSSHENA